MDLGCGTVEELDIAEQPNVQRAIESYLAGAGRSAELVGVIGPHGRSDAVHLADLVAADPGRSAGASWPTEGPLQYVNVSIGDETELRCLRSGLLLIREGGSRLAVLVDHESGSGPWEPLRVEVVSPDEAAAERFLAALRAAMREHN